MITTDKILKSVGVKTSSVSGLQTYLKENVKLAIIEYATEILKYAAEKALLNSYSYKGSYTIEGSYSIDDYTDLTVDKDSILNIIKELK